MLLREKEKLQDKKEQKGRCLLYATRSKGTGYRKLEPPNKVSDFIKVRMSSITEGSKANGRGSSANVARLKVNVGTDFQEAGAVFQERAAGYQEVVPRRGKLYISVCEFQQPAAAHK